MSGANLYHYGTPEEGEHFTGRTKELAALLARMRGGVNGVVIWCCDLPSAPQQDVANKPSFSFDATIGPTTLDMVLSDVYQLLASEGQHRLAVLMLDEFQGVCPFRLVAHLPDLLKGLAEAHPTVSLVLAGSKRRLMEQMLVERTAPLYGLAQHLALGPSHVPRWSLT